MALLKVVPRLHVVKTGPVQRIVQLKRTILGQPSQFVSSIWLFTFSDLKTIIATSFAFGLFTSLGAASFGIQPTSPWSRCVQRIPMVLLWAWLNLLPETIANQRQPDAIMEDAVNKPWRTMPSKRMTPEEAGNVMYMFYLIALGTSSWVGGLAQCITLIGFGFWYNNLRGADASCIIRNLINSAGILCFLSGALQIQMTPIEWESFIRSGGPGMSWLAIIGAIVFTTVQTQDLCDQAGDEARGRRTLPLVIGDASARWVTAVLIVFWGIFGPGYWGWLQGGPESGALRWAGGLLATLACTIAARILMYRSVPADQTSWMLWNLWMVNTYGLPLWASLGKV